MEKDDSRYPHKRFWALDPELYAALRSYRFKHECESDVAAARELLRKALGLKPETGKDKAA